MLIYLYFFIWINAAVITSVICCTRIEYIIIAHSNIFSADLGFFN